MTPAQVAHIMSLVEEYAGDYARATTENLYGTSKSYTKQCFEAANESRAAIEAALRDAPQAEPTEAQIDAYCEAWGAAFEAEEPEAFGVTVEPLSASLRRCIVAGLRAAISAPTAVEPDERATCEWTLEDDDNGTWQSSCGELWSFIEGGPKENRVSFCHNCGKPAIVRASKGTPL